MLTVQTGFDGSAGCAVITMDKAALFTDGRYFNQASKQLDSNWTLMKQGLPDVPTWNDWTVLESSKNGKVGIDPTLIPASSATKLKEKLQADKSASLMGIADNLVDQIWGNERPKRPENPLTVQVHKYSGKKSTDKLSDLRKFIKDNNGQGYIVSMLDEIAWLFNLRGSDIPYNPVFFSYAFITLDEATLYISENHLTSDVKNHLGASVKIKPYDAIFSELKSFKIEADSKILVSNRVSWALQEALGASNVKEVSSPITLAKAVKNQTEIQGMRECNIRDGLALIQYFAWLEQELAKKTDLDEVTAADELERLRSEKDLYVGLSFPTISGVGSNAAIIHYQPQRDDCGKMDPSKVYLCDSGAQYCDGTTDTTRTLHFGTPTDEEILAYTLVLKGHVAIATAVFPKSTTGYILDVLARQYLWAYGLDYRHGTGHGIGSYLNVHEGPQGIGARPAFNETPLEPGMVISNEPGFYKDDYYGIRIENDVIVKVANTPNTFGDRPYYEFETITMAPYARSLINVSLLTEPERVYINKYHKVVFDTISPLIEKSSYVYQWLERETSPL